MPTQPPQYAGRGENKRNDHIWVRRKGGGWKCVLCGAVTGTDNLATKPPDRPEPDDWSPERYETLTAAERSLSPYEPEPR